MGKTERTSQNRKAKVRLLTILAIASIVLLAIIGFRSFVHRTRELTCRVVFGTNMKGLVSAMMIYSKEDEHRRVLPADKWCDLLIEGDYCQPQQFRNNDSDAIVGESNVAINKNVAGKEWPQLDPDVVLLFETDFGKDRQGRKGLMKNRGYYKTFQIDGPDTKVYKHRWNQAGGPEILTTKYNDGKGCNVAFIGGYVKWIKTADLPNLKWKPDPNDK